MGIVRFMTAGSVDDGKSTLIGRLFHDAGLIPSDQLEGLGGAECNLAHFTDGLREEREQGITIDVAYRYFETPQTKFIVADAPGHSEFTRNMVSAASQADLVLILVDVTRGITEQTKRHASICQWLGKDAFYLINKMDLLGYQELAFQGIANELAKFSSYPAIPLSALKGDNVLQKSNKLPWYHGPCLFDLLHAHAPKSAIQSQLVFPVQLSLGHDVLGTPASGSVSKGQKLRVAGTKELVHVKERIGEIALRLTLDQTVMRGQVLVAEDFREEVGAVWNIEWCQLVEGAELTQAALVMKHGTAELKVVAITRRSEAHGICTGELRLEDSVVKVNEGQAILIDQGTHQTVAALFLKRKASLLI